MKELGQAQQSKLALFVKRVFTILRFMYNLFITIQLAYLGYAEGVRLGNMVSFLLNNSKIVRIRNKRNEN